MQILSRLFHGLLDLQLTRGLLDLVFAPTCVACGGLIPAATSERMVCATCWSRVRALPTPRCDRCWTPLPVGTLSGGAQSSCSLCPGLRPAVRAVRSVYLHDGPIRPLVHALKYRGWYAAAEPMAVRMASVPFPEEVEEEAELVVPVPLSPTRRRERGYNQAAELAAGVARLRGLQYEPNVLARGRTSGSQTALHPTERRANVAGAFRALPECAARLAGRHVLLVDDVWTTGATALACTDTLLDAGARAVSVLTFARALPDLEDLSRRAARVLEAQTG